MGKIKIYTLACPFTGNIKYVGKTVKSDLNARLGEHIQDSKRKHYYGLKHNWVNSLYKTGIKPKIELICEVDDLCWKEEEVFYISYLRFLGFDLKNTTLGGEGVHGMKLSDEHKLKISIAHKSRIKTPEQIEQERERFKNIRYNNKGIPMSEEQKIKISKANKGKKHTEETRKKISQKLMGNIVSSEARAKISAFNKGKKVIRTKEQIEKHRAAITGKPSHNKGKKMSELCCIKMKIGSYGQKNKNMTKDDREFGKNNLRIYYRNLGYDV